MKHEEECFITYPNTEKCVEYIYIYRLNLYTLCFMNRLQIKVKIYRWYYNANKLKLSIPGYYCLTHSAV